MRRTLLITAIVAAVLVPSAAAHELTVVDAGDAELDLGQVDSPRLLHGTLAGADDDLALTVHGAGRPLQVLLLVPDIEPERSADARPALSGGEHVTGEPRLTDPATDVTYRVVARRDLPALREGSTIALDVTRGPKPTRVAVLVGDPDATFASTDLDRTPKTLLRLRGWSATPAKGSEPRHAGSTSGDDRGPWYGAAIALIALLTAVWWVRAGRARSRAEGAARAAREADSSQG